VDIVLESMLVGVRCEPGSNTLQDGLHRGRGVALLSGRLVDRVGSGVGKRELCIVDVVVVRLFYERGSLRVIRLCPAAYSCMGKPVLLVVVVVGMWLLVIDDLKVVYRVRVLAREC
jgi:hypothetical protein